MSVDNFFNIIGIRFNTEIIMRPTNKIITKWSHELAYSVGLIATDGCLYKDGRHMAFISRDVQLIKVFMKCLGLKNKISKKESGFLKGSYSYWVQFGDIRFYRFLISLGLTPAKSKILGQLKIPKQYFFDFLRGSFDGDGSFYSYWDKRWASSFMFYLVFISASQKHIEWIQNKIDEVLNVRGHISHSVHAKTFQLRYAKSESRQIFKKMYHSSNLPRLERKYKKVYTALTVDKKNR